MTPAAHLHIKIIAAIFVWKRQTNRLFRAKSAVKSQPIINIEVILRSLLSFCRRSDSFPPLFKVSMSCKSRSVIFESYLNRLRSLLSFLLFSN